MDRQKCSGIRNSYLGILFLVYGRDIPTGYSLAKLKPPTEAIRDRRTFMTSWSVLALLLVGFFALEPLGVPVSLIAAVAALILYCVARRTRIIDTTRVLRHAPGKLSFFPSVCIWWSTDCATPD